MSKLNPAGRSIASKSIYDVLVVDSGEESEEEAVSEVEEPQSASQEASKPTKSAIKKAQKLARIERRQQQKLQKKEATRQRLSSASPSPPVTSGPKDDDSSGRSSPDAGALSESTTLHVLDVAPQQTPPAAVTVESPPPPPVTKPAPPVVESKPAKPSAAAPPPKPAPAPAPSPAPSLPAKVATEAKSEVAHLLLPKATNGSPTSTTNSSHSKTSAADAEKAKKRANALERVVWTFIMIFGFIALLLMGHAYMILLVMLCQTLVYREVTALFSLKSSSAQESHDKQLKGKDPWSKTLNWYFFAVTNYFLYGESIIYYFKHVVFTDAQLLPFATNHRMISFMLYTIGFMGFVMSLKKGYLKQQFGLFCWVHMSLLIIVFSSHFIVNNILEGLIWFWVPASLVICNDCWAYVCGVTMGRTPLISLSPKKTVEGFVGAFVCTLIFAVGWGTYFMRFNYMICPVHDLGVSAFTSMACQPNQVFVWRSAELWKPLSILLSTLLGRSITSISYTPYQLHLLVLACFASLVAPFGGFFASGFKRAFNIKDFGHSIPGHGGITDRMDCQFLMGVFTYVYYSSLIRSNNISVGGILQTVVSNLSLEDQVQLVHDLTKYLGQQGVVV